jgi:cytochrome b6-f complex iron-sulfur subunit
MMKKTADNSCPGENNAPECAHRRQFLVSASATAGGLVLSLAGAAAAQDKMTPAEELVIKLAADSPLAKVGGSQTVETKAGKVIVARTGEMSFAAYAAKCTHSGGPLKYDSEAKEFTCPWHGSRFGADGKNLGGPAKRPLTAFPTETALVIGLKTA